MIKVEITVKQFQKCFNEHKVTFLLSDEYAEKVNFIMSKAVDELREFYLQDTQKKITVS